MYTLSHVTWMTLWGLSFLFVGGGILWIYGGTDRPLGPSRAEPQTERALLFFRQPVEWFLLYGRAAVFIGAGLLLTAAVSLI